ncbi:DUF7544 domain-containing protein [Halobaculum lipolyticum]|uniref:Membrane domain of glycerophosphoryl diester phosphodiesterase n=1 Tax=Halobaculum lipolyticum TaxID=3032001 RepID=A0ABD5W9Y8_9EURY|nr:hypothetical protein [Halobaculum sp. DT31]
MSWHGVDAVDDAIDATRGFLFPVRLGRWARMAVVTLFAGGSSTGQVANNAANAGTRLAGTAGSNGAVGAAGAAASLLLALPALAVAAGPSLPAGLAGAVPLQSLPSPPVGALGAVGFLVVAVVLLVGLGLFLVTPAFEFVLVDGIARDELRILRDVRAHFVNGLRLLGFRIGTVAAFVVPPAAVAAAAVLSGVDTSSLASRPLVLVALGLAVLAYLIVFAFVWRFTVEFVVPAMVADGGGVIDGWRRVWPLLRGQAKQTVVYLVMHFLVGIGVSIVGFVLLLFGLLLVGVVAGVVGLAVGALAGGTGGTELGVGLGVLAGVVVGVPLFVLAVAFPVGILTLTFRRSYELAALGRFSEGLDLLGRYRNGGGEDVAAALGGGHGDDDDDDPPAGVSAGASGRVAGEDRGGDADGRDADDGDGDDDDFGGFVSSSVRDDDATDPDDLDDSDDPDTDRQT